MWEYGNMIEHVMEYGNGDMRSICTDCHASLIELRLFGSIGSAKKNRVSGIVWLEVEVVFNEHKGHPSLLVCMTYGSELHLTLCRSQHVLIFCIHSDLGPLKTLVLHQDAVFSYFHSRIESLIHPSQDFYPLKTTGFFARFCGILYVEIPPKNQPTREDFIQIFCPWELGDFPKAKNDSR